MMTDVRNRGPFRTDTQDQHREYAGEVAFDFGHSSIPADRGGQRSLFLGLSDRHRQLRMRVVVLAGDRHHLLQHGREKFISQVIFVVKKPSHCRTVRIRAAGYEEHDRLVQRFVALGHIIRR